LLLLLLLLFYWRNWQRKKKFFGASDPSRSVLPMGKKAWILYAKFSLIN
jgi:hypothetical protein